MKHFLIVITWYDPFPKEFRYQEGGGQIWTAVARALRQFKSENKGRRVKQLSIKVTQL